MKIPGFQKFQQMFYLLLQDIWKKKRELLFIVSIYYGDNKKLWYKWYPIIK
jgi:hypothetical protein